MLEDLSKAREKYAVINIYFIMPVKDFLLKDYPRGGKPQTESVWNIDDLLAQPLTEMTMLPADYYNIYHEATSTIITEANAMALDGYNGAGATPSDTSGDAQEKPGLLSRIKAMLMKLVNFLMDAYGRLFPKTLLDFSKLALKYKKSEKLMKACHENENMLKIMELEIPNIEGIYHAFADLINYANTRKVPVYKIEQYQRPGNTRIVIFWGDYVANGDKMKSNINGMGFCVASDSRKAKDNPGVGRNLIRIATYLSEDTLLEAFGIRVTGPSGNLMGIRQVTDILKVIKVLINTDVNLWKKRSRS